jgi:phage antirepressor YoqD-like protein
MGTAKTNSKGRFTQSTTAKKGGYWSAVWWTPNARDVSAFSAEDHVDVR